MKKTLSRYSFYLFTVSVCVRLAFRAFRLAVAIYCRALLETKLNFVLVNGVFFKTSKSIFDQHGNVKSDFLPYMTEALQLALVLGDSNPEPYEFSSEYAKRLSSVTLTPEKMKGKMIDVLTALLLTRTDPQSQEVELPFNDRLSLNELCFALSLDMNIHNDYFQCQSLVSKVLACKLNSKEMLDCTLRPEIALEILESGALRGSDWAKKGTVNIDLFRKMAEKGIIPKIDRLAADDLLLSEWASGTTSGSAHRYLDDPDINRIAKAAIRHQKPINLEMYQKYAEEFSLYGLPPNLVQKKLHEASDSEPETSEPSHPPLYPKNWKKHRHYFDKTTILAMLKDDNPAIKAEALAICVKHKKTIDLNYLAERSDNPELYILFETVWWKQRWGCYQERHHNLLPIFIRNHPKIIRHYAEKGLDMGVLMTAMGSIENPDFYPRKIRKASTKKLMQIALVKNCPYAIFKLSAMDESLLLSTATELPEFEMIFNFCQNKHPQNLSRYPGKVRDQQFGIDLGL